jgi:ADP-heptose:LPS heptosyltransferase
MMQGRVMPDIDPSSRILVARLDSLGDCVLGSSFFIGLRSLFPKAHLTGVFSVSTSPLFQASPALDHVVSIPTDSTETWHRPIQPPYDVAILPRWDVDYWSTRRLAILSQAPVRIGFDRGSYFYDHSIDGWAGAYFTDLVRTRSDLHEVLKSRQMLQYLGMAEPAPDPCLWLTKAAKDWASEFLEGNALDHFAVITVAAGSQNRIWPVENFLPVIDALRSRSNLRFVVVGAHDAIEAGAWLQQLRPEIVVCATGSIPVLSTAAIIARSRIYIGMDTGPMHLAAATRVPVVEISCHPRSGRLDHPNSPSRFGPYATRSRVLQPARSPEMCSDGCNIVDAPHCIRAIQAADVIDAALQLLGTLHPPTPESVAKAL